MRARLGCAGRTLAETVAHLLRHLPEPGLGPPDRAAARTADALGRRFGLPASVRSLPGWEPAWRARAVALWGARLASLGPPPCAAGYGSILLEAAAFNLAVALFDTVADEMPGALSPLAAALHPRLLERCLDHPDGGKLRKPPVATEFAVVPRLFEFTLAGAGRRYRADPAHRAELGGLLRRMYESEIGLSGEPVLAKTLPVVWIGRLGGAADGSETDRMFNRLARFVARWDDAQDLHDDWLRGRYNAYLAPPGRRWSRAGGALAGIYRLAFARRSVSGVRFDLESLLLDALDAAGRCGRREAVARFLADLIGGRS